MSISIDPPSNFVDQAHSMSLEFARECATTVHETYKKRNIDQTMERTTFQLYYSKLAEFYVHWWLSRLSPRMKCTQPDVKIYHSLSKSFDADLHCIGTTTKKQIAVHVKSCLFSFNVAPSWNGQWGGSSGKGSDNHLFGNDTNSIEGAPLPPQFMAFVQCDINGVDSKPRSVQLHGLVQVKTIQERQLWQLPIKQSLADNKRFVYLKHNSNADLQHLSETERFDTNHLTQFLLL